jgi:hypothetical protein
MKYQPPPFAEAGDFTECYIGYAEDDPQAVLYDSRSYSRARALSAHQSEYPGPPAKVTTAYARWLALDEQWEMSGRDRWPDLQDYEDEPPEAPEDRPADWCPDEYDHSFALCTSKAEGAVKVWRCEVSS